MEHLAWSARCPLVKGKLLHIPKKSGVYRVVTPERFGRLRNQSNIVYIGCSYKGQQGLWLEIGNPLNPQRQHYYTLKLIRESGLQLEYQYVTALPKEAEDIEYHLPEQYEREYLELPPANRSKPKHQICGFCQSAVNLQALYQD